MNKQRRKQIADITEQLHELWDRLADVMTEENDALERLMEYFPESEKAEEMSEKVEAMQEALDNLEDVFNTLEELL